MKTKENLEYFSVCDLIDALGNYSEEVPIAVYIDGGDGFLLADVKEDEDGDVYITNITNENPLTVESLTAQLEEHDEEANVYVKMAPYDEEELFSVMSVDYDDEIEGEEEVVITVSDGN